MAHVMTLKISVAIAGLYNFMTASSKKRCWNSTGERGCKKKSNPLREYYTRPI
jgi:hypothetical protein